MSSAAAREAAPRYRLDWWSVRLIPLFESAPQPCHQSVSNPVRNPPTSRRPARGSGWPLIRTLRAVAVSRVRTRVLGTVTAHETTDRDVNAGTTDRNPDKKPLLDRPNGHRLTGSSLTIGHMNQTEDRNPLSPRHCQHGITACHPGSPLTRPGSNPPQHHTQLQQVAGCIHVDILGVSGC